MLTLLNSARGRTDWGRHHATAHLIHLILRCLPLVIIKDTTGEWPWVEMEKIMANNMISAVRRTYLNSRSHMRRRQEAGVSLCISEAPYTFGSRYILS